MPRGNFDTAVIDTRGLGHQGFCKYCALKDPVLSAELDERCRSKWSPAQINDWLTKKGYAVLVGSKTTIYSHRQHVMHPQDKVVSAVQRSEQKALKATPKTTPELFLQSVVSIGQQRIVERPEDVTIDQALRAASELNRAKDSTKGALAELVALFTTMRNVTPPVEQIEGEFSEV